VNQYKPGPVWARPLFVRRRSDDGFSGTPSTSASEAAERRRTDLAEQCSRLKTAEERIRIWSAFTMRCRENCSRGRCGGAPRLRLADVLGVPGKSIIGSSRTEQRVAQTGAWLILIHSSLLTG